MENVISLQERRLKKQIKKAYEDLKEIRTLISYGHYERTHEAIELEDQIVVLENQLLQLVESDSF